jgi:hypothetical protein
MSKVLKMKREISAKAFVDLGHSGVTHAGTVVVLADGDVMTELRRAGVIGKNDGLTILGSALAGMAQEFVFDLAF